MLLELYAVAVLWGAGLANLTYPFWWQSSTPPCGAPSPSSANWPAASTRRCWTTACRCRSALAPAIEAIAYFCAAELLANVAKHSYANEIKININTERAGEVLCLVVSDDGFGGVDSRAAVSPGAAAWPGSRSGPPSLTSSLTITRPPGGPTRVTVDMPLRA